MNISDIAIDNVYAQVYAQEHMDMLTITTFLNELGLHSVPLHAFGTTLSC